MDEKTITFPKANPQPPKAFVNDDGIWMPIGGNHYRCVMTKELFVEAYKRFIEAERGEE